MKDKLNLKEEEICNFIVSTKRKKIWQKELDILEKIIQICEKNNIQYSLSGGSLLGAVRHQGYIPWDDDIDIIMKRKEYNNFLNIAEKEFKYPYFIQYYKTEKNYIRGHAQIRNSETTAILENENDCFNKGIFVDIFPLDNVPDNNLIKNIFLKNIILKKRIIMIKKSKSNKNLKDMIKGIIKRRFNLEKLIYKYEKYIQKYNNKKTKQSGAIGYLPYEFKYDNSWFENYIELPFEYLNVKCIKDYDKLLTRQYGNYMEIPKDKNGNKHGNILFDTEKSYKEYEKEKKI